MGWALPVQVSWAVLSAIWNITGTLMISQSLKALGPTATWTTAVVLLVLAAALMWTVERLPLLYLILTLIMGAGAFYTVIFAFTGNPSLWPSVFWRWAGASLNSAGTACATAATVSFFRWKAGRQG